jgi:hypothetical protein
MNKSHLKGVCHTIIGAVLTASVFPAVSADPVPMTVHPLDKKQPEMPGEGAIPKQSSGSGGSNMCWAPPNPDDLVMTGAFGSMSGHKSSPHAGNDLRARQGKALYAVADGCVSFGNPTPRQLIGVKMRINDVLPNASVWYLHMSRVDPKFINDGRNKLCIPVKKGELLGYTGNSFGTGGRINDVANAYHLHLSYYASGLMLNPLPLNKLPAKAVDPRFHVIKGEENIVGGKLKGDYDASGTAGSVLGFGFPRFCDTYTYYSDSKITNIPYKQGAGLGFYTAQAKAPTQEELEANAKKVREATGMSPDGKAPEQVALDPNTWNGGAPEEPDWDSYADMSFLQIVHSEVTRRSGNSRWAEELTEQSARGLMMENLRIRALRMQVQYEMYLSRQRTEAMLASLLAAEAKKMQLSFQRIVAQGLTSPVK